MIASTSAPSGCKGYTGVGWVFAAVYEGPTRLLGPHANNSHGYVQTAEAHTNRSISVQDGCYNAGAHPHEFECWSYRST